MTKIEKNTIQDKSIGVLLWALVMVHLISIPDQSVDNFPSRYIKDHL